MNSSVITFPGSNCDRDMGVALKKFGFKNKIKDETKGYYYLGLFFIVISIILFLISIEN